MSPVAENTILEHAGWELHPDPELNLIGTASDRITCRPYGARSVILPLILWVWRPYGAGEGRTARNSSSRDDPVISLMHHRIMSGRELVRSRLYNDRNLSVSLARPGRNLASV